MQQPFAHTLARLAFFSRRFLFAPATRGTRAKCSRLEARARNDFLQMSELILKDYRALLVAGPRRFVFPRRKRLRAVIDGRLIAHG